MKVGGMEAGNSFFQWGGEKDSSQLPAFEKNI